ncbi:transcription factor IIIB 90 kDa subunit [Parasteatoda tepidariorum]|uniref:transcription factor IIIB 90 kDa subunit n=1 Tax=Parasteatoda tepidariorum TaxID=114398 RepID=UPI00077FB3D0|nr:transcription factor IIIB 90 kDa subunit [Parasteatoda tepidariorum]
MQCQCGSTDIDTDSGRVDSVCRQCGSVLEDCGIVTDVQYMPDSTGATRAVGSLIKFDEGPYGFHRSSSEKESRAITLLNARKNIESLALKLQLKSRAIDAAYKFYRMALSKQLTKGRKSTHVVAACVYMHCRQESTPHMLLDFSEILKINVYELGKTYLKLSSALCIQAPILDPALYIARFAHQLEFGDKEEAVVCVASKLVARMRSDWIHLGRRPSGLCGAALLVAARLYNFNRTIDDIIKVVKVCQATVRKRLNEFSDTPSGKLSIDDFMEVNLSEEQDPPCFKNARRKLRELEDENKAKELEKQVTEIRKEIEKVLENSKKKSMYENMGAEESIDSPPTSSLKSVDMLVAENTVDSLKDIIQENDSSETSIDNFAPIFMQESNIIEDSASSANDSGYSSHIIEPSLADIGLKGGSSKSSSQTTVSEKKEESVDESLDLTGVDDEELEIYFMKPHEYKRKDEVWHTYNADYLQELKEREERKALEEEENAKKPNRKKRKRKIVQGEPDEVLQQIVQQKKISFKLDYDVLKSLNPENMSVEKSEPDVEKKTVETPPVQNRARPKKPPPRIPFNIKKGMSDIVGNSRRKAMAALIEEQNNELEELSEQKSKLDNYTPEPEKTEIIDLTDGVSLANKLLENGNNELPDIEEVEDEEEEDDYESDSEIYNYKDDIPPDFYAEDEYVDDYED